MITQQAFLLRQFVEITDHDGGYILDATDNGTTISVGLPSDASDEHIIIQPFKVLALGDLDTSYIGYLFHKMYGTSSQQMVSFLKFKNNSGTPQVYAGVLSWTGSAGWQYSTQNIELDKWYFYVTRFINEDSNDWNTECYVIGPDELDENHTIVNINSTASNASMIGSVDRIMIYAGDTVNTNTGTILVAEPVIGWNIPGPMIKFRHPMIHGENTEDYYTLEEYADDLPSPLDNWTTSEIDQVPGDYDSIHITHLYADDNSMLHNLDINLDVVDTVVDDSNDKLAKLTDFSTVSDEDYDELLAHFATIGDYRDMLIMADENIGPNDILIPDDFDAHDLDPGHTVPPLQISDEVTPVETDLSAIFGIS